MHDGKNVGIKV